MMGRIGFSHSYGETLSYCLQDKRQSRDRAEILYYHLCYGNTTQLIHQFEEVQKRNLNVIKPALHLSLSLPAKDKISKGQFVDIARECAKALDFEHHQYVVILHKDTAHPHVHLVVNRVATDKHLMDGWQMLKRVDQFCRETELKHHLTPVEHIRKYQSPEERNRPSQNLRVVHLKEAIRQTLTQTHDLTSFNEQMLEHGYKVHKTDRGISFKDKDGVYFTGSKVDYPWKKVEAALTHNLSERLAQEQRLEQERIRQLEIKRKQAPEQDDEPRQVQRRGLRMRM